MSRVRCLTCGAKKTVDFGACLSHGWPRCHGETMWLVGSPSAKTIDAAVKKTMARRLRQTKGAK